MKGKFLFNVTKCIHFMMEIEEHQRYSLLMIMKLMKQNLIGKTNKIEMSLPCVKC